MTLQRHWLHDGDRVWPESNCYVDLWIGALQANGLNPMPMLACTIAPQFDVDQWTFCKPTASELADLYRVRIEELNVWRPAAALMLDHVCAGRLVLVETDAFYLPDTAGVSYQIAHQKTTIGIDAYDQTSGTLTYFHNAGHFALDRDHVTAVLNCGVTSATLPAFAEFADFRRHVVRTDGEAAEIALRLASRRIAATTDLAPFKAWHEVADRQLATLADGDMTGFHAWAFSTMRQAGAMAELSGLWCHWMRDHVVENPHDKWTVAGDAFLRIAQTLAAQQFRLARVVGNPNIDNAVVGFRSALQRCDDDWCIGRTAMLETLQLSRGANPATTAVNPLLC